MRITATVKAAREVLGEVRPAAGRRFGRFEPLGPPPERLPVGGPLGLHAPEEPRPPGTERVERCLVGRTRDGIPEVRLAIGQGLLAGVEVRLFLGARGVEVAFVLSAAMSGAAEQRLRTIAKALEARGVRVRRGPPWR